MRSWIAAALLAGSWLFGLGYFNPPDHVAWLSAVVLATLLLSGLPLRLPSRGQRLTALLLVIPAVWYVPAPHKIIPLLLLLGLALSLLPVPSALPRRLARGALIASAILVPQSLVLLGYQAMTARGHELPRVLAGPLLAVIRLLGGDAVLDSSAVVLRNASVTIRASATWELLIDPASLCFVAGGIVLLLLLTQRISTPARRWRALGRLVVVLVCTGIVWAPLRAALLLGTVLQQQLRADAATYPNVGELLVSTWVHLGLVIAFAALVATLVARVRLTASSASPRGPKSVVVPFRPWTYRLGFILLGSAVAVATFLHFWVPVGQRKAGRVMVMERHSTWEPTTERYGTKVYGEAGSYNYAAIYEYCGQFYEMSRLLPEDTITPAALAHCDVLIIKTPTSRYSTDEVAAIVQFVEEGGALLMVGDHTNVFNMNTYLNDISRHLGFTFRNDLLFRIGSPYKQAYAPPKIGHPVLQHVPAMFFAVSCSIDPGDHRGTMVIRNVGLWNLPPAYQETNYHPQAEYRPNMQYGAWCQLWSTVHGKGRVLAFADSTLFSNFCTFQPGKSELFLGMLEWLNRSSRFDGASAQRWLGIIKIAAAVLACIIGAVLIRQQRGAWILASAVMWLAWTLATSCVVACHQGAMPLPPAPVPPEHQPIPHVVIDRTLSTVPLFTGAFADDPEGGGYGLLEQWIPRIGNYISRQTGGDAFQGDGLVVIVPTELPGQRYREQLVEWVRAGGRLLVLDTPDVPECTANSLLMLFGLKSVHNAPELEDTPLRLADGSLDTPLQMSCAIEGGVPIAVWGDTPVASQITFGSGCVTAIGFGSLFNDENMGYHWLPEPEPDLLRRYEVLYALLRAGLE